MTWWAPVVEVTKRHFPKIAAWLLTKFGGEWVLDRIEGAVSSVGERQNAIRKARQFEGRFGTILLEGRSRYVVYKDEQPIETFPPIEGDLAKACKGYDLDRLRSPSDLFSARARDWARSRFRNLADRLKRGEEQTAFPAGDGEAMEGAELAEAEASLGKQAFDELIAEMEPMLIKLTSAPAMPLAEHSEVPVSAGIYFFSEGPNPVYVGQSRNISRRLKQHTSPKSHENQAPLAFNIALGEAAIQGLKPQGTRVKGQQESPLVATNFPTRFEVADPPRGAEP